jgi:hypothetical protein
LDALHQSEESNTKFQKKRKEGRKISKTRDVKIRRQNEKQEQKMPLAGADRNMPWHAGGRGALGRRNYHCATTGLFPV